MINPYPNKASLTNYYKVPEATEILAQWGISKTEKKTRDLISKNRLNAKTAGNNPNDRRSGFLISEKSIYDLIVEEIPLAKQIIEKERSSMPKASKPKRAAATKENELKQEQA
jgi:hypothetical protein